ncbi:MAG TPA: homocysteine S-methyltransferase family protein [Acidobacteriota bacterium]|nr:homocysteine S-methyltransferase family protein [Acidobacteriota bacterium]
MPCQTTLLDGAQGTRLQQLGLPAITPSPRWNVENPSKVTEMHRLYLDAGSQILLTNTFGAVEQVEFEGALRCIEPFQGQCQIGGSIGPLTVLRHAEILSGLIDFYVLETFSDTKSAIDALKTLEKFGKPIVVSFAWIHEDGFRLLSREPMMKVIQEISTWPLMAFGANCNLGSKLMAEFGLALAHATHVPVWIKSNSGQPRWVDGKAVYDQSPDDFATELQSLIGVAKYLGGCCGTDERHIAALRKLLLERQFTK